MLVKLRPKTFVGTEIETRPTSETNILFWAKFEVKSETRPILRPCQPIGTKPDQV